MEFSSIKTNDLARALQKSAGFCNEVKGMNYSYVQRNVGGTKQCVFFASPWSKNYQRHQAEEWYEECHSEYSAEFKDFFFVYIGNSDVRKIKDYNSICINETTGRYYVNRHDKRFNDIIDTIIQRVKFEKCHDKIRAYNLYGAESIREPLESVVPYVLVAILAIVFWRTGGGKAFETWGVSTAQPKEYFRLFTYMFCHANYLHLIGNAISLIVFGSWLGRLRGGIHTALTFIVGGVLAGAVSLITHLYMGTDAVTVGASGAIFAIYGAYTFASIVDYGDFKGPIKRALVLLVLNSFGGVDVACHVGGFVAGLWMGFLAYGFSRSRINYFADKAVADLKKFDVGKELAPTMKGV